MAYVPDYTANDMSGSIINTIVVIILVIGSFAAIVALVLLARFAMGKKLVK